MARIAHNESSSYTALPPAFFCVESASHVSIRQKRSLISAAVEELKTVTK